VQAQFKQPHSIQFGPDGDLFVCDIGNHVIRRINMKTGIISTFAGTGTAGATPDGAPIQGRHSRGRGRWILIGTGTCGWRLGKGTKVFKFDLKAGAIHHIAGTGKSGFCGKWRACKRGGVKGAERDRD